MVLDLTHRSLVLSHSSFKNITKNLGVSLEQLETFSKEFPQTPMHYLLEVFENIVKVDNNYVFSLPQKTGAVEGEQVVIM